MMTGALFWDEAGLMLAGGSVRVQVHRCPYCLGQKEKSPAAQLHDSQDAGPVLLFLNLKMELKLP